MRHGVRVARWVRFVVVLVLVAGLALAPGGCARRLSDAKDLKEQLGALRSTLTETIIIVQRQEQGALTPAAARSALDRRERDLDAIASRLRSARPKPGLEPSYAAAADLAERAISTLRAIARPGAPPESIRASWSPLFEIRDFTAALDEMPLPAEEDRR